MASVSGWGSVLGLLAGKMRGGISTILPALRGALVGGISYT